MIHLAPISEPEETPGGNGVDLSEDGIALVFAEQHSDRLRYDHTLGQWFVWAGQAWRREDTQLAMCLARNLCRELGYMTQAKTNRLSKAATISAVERLARCDRDLAVTSELWDQDPWLLGTPGGTVDLTTGTLRTAQRSDHISRLTSVAPADTEDCPKWLTFLQEVTSKDDKLIRFMAQWMGYSLTGDTREQSLIFVYGTGGNGKGTFLRTTAGILGDYAVTAAMETFTASSSDRHPTDLAMLRGARMVSATETEEGRRWAESRINQLTGQDRISARFMRQDFFQFTPQLKLIVIGNHHPVLRNVTEAAKRRFNIVPFEFRPKTPNAKIEDDLRPEWPGILRWMINGCLDWQENGLIRPDVVTKATRDYFSEQDLITQWIEDACERGPFWCASKELFKNWTAYALAVGENAGTHRWLSDNLVRLGYKPGKQGGTRGFDRIKVKASPPPRQFADPEDDPGYGEQGAG